MTPLKPEMEEVLTLLEEVLDFVLDCHAYHFGNREKAVTLMEKLTLMIQHHNQRRYEDDHDCKSGCPCGHGFDDD